MQAPRGLLSPLWALTGQHCQRSSTCGSPLLAIPVQLGGGVASCSTSAPAAGEQLIQHWQQLLQQGRAQGSVADSTQQLKQLLSEALRVHSKQAHSAVLPEQATAVWMQAHKALTHSDDAAKRHFFWVLCNDFGVQSTAPPEALLKAAERLQAASKPLYLQLLLPVSQHAEGIRFLLNMRADLLCIIRTQPAHAAPLRALSEHLRCALAEWFTTGLLELQSLSWQSSAALLEKVAASEAVHAVDTWQQLKQRLGPNRRVFCFFHPSLPGEPLVVLHTALMDTIPADMHSILQPLAAAHEEPLPAQQQQRVACFYSISSTQPGLSGVDLGNSLIKRVAKQLLAELPQLQHLVTLSPIPGFREWLIVRLQQEAVAATAAAEGAREADSAAPLLLEADVNCLATIIAQQHAHRRGQPGKAAPATQRAAAKALLHLTQDDRWLQHADALRPVLMRLCAVYLLHERRRNNAVDPVANFHLKNGAWMWRLNWGADPTPAGHQRSFGIMVNYKYVLEDVQSNNRAYLMEHRIAASPAMLAWVAGVGE